LLRNLSNAHPAVKQSSDVEQSFGDQRKEQDVTELEGIVASMPTAGSGMRGVKRRAVRGIQQDIGAYGRSVHGSVVDTIGKWILGGTYPPGQLLPREDDLADKLKVSRTSIREAVKVLSAKGLLDVRRRVGVRVRARDDWNMLDPQVLSWHPDVGRDKELIGGLIEARRIIEPAAAALAATRATAADLARIERAYEGMERNLRVDLAACCEADLQFHVGLIAASHNVVLKGLTGTIEAALRATFTITNRLVTAQSRALAAHKAVLECVRLRDSEGARTAIVALLDIAASDLDQKRLGNNALKAAGAKKGNP
jgi:GntR family galactonate operon transcriptional repressor